MYEATTGLAMHHRGKISVLLNSFLGTFVSRNADYGGYWLYGFLARYPDVPVMNLFETVDERVLDPVIRYTHQLAANRFRELATQLQVLKYVQSAELRIHRERTLKEVWTIGPPRQGYRLVVSLVVIDDRGRAFERTVEVTAAMHNPAYEISRIQ